MPHNKKHHYVPRFYLKNFGNGVGSSINIFNIPSNKTIVGGSLKSQCYKNYLYGKDQVIEKSLSVIEGKACEAISAILKSRHLPARFSGQHFALLAYVVIQWGRTPAAGAMLSQMMNDVYQNVLIDMYAVDAAKEGISREELSECTMQYDEPERASLSLVASVIPISLDLHFNISVARQWPADFAAGHH